MTSFGLLGKATDFETRRLDGQLGLVPNMTAQIAHNGGPLLVTFATDVALGGNFDHHCTFEVYIDGLYTGYGNRAEVALGAPLVYFPHSFAYTIPDVPAGKHTIEVRYSKHTGQTWVNNGGRVTAMSVWG